MADVLYVQANTLIAALEENAGPRRDLWLGSLLSLLEQDSQLRLDFYYILIAFGCSGAIDAVAYLQQMRSPSHPC